jgi:hypothetical protein
MVPPGATSLVGVRMAEVRNSAFYKELIQQNKLPSVDQFARETGFDPRRDVREILFASTKSGGVLLARGVFHVNAVKEAKPLRHGVYTVQALGTNGYCVLDATLAIAGDIPTVNAALDEWTSGKHTAAQPLLARGKQIEPDYPFWGVSFGFAGFLADNMPRAASGVDFSKIFRGLEDTWFEATFTNGFKGTVHGATAADADAVSLRDTAKGLIGFGRLNVPENQPDMLKLWDGISVEQEGRSVSIRIDVAQNLVDQLVRMLGSAQSGRGRGRGRGRI